MAAVFARDKEIDDRLINFSLADRCLLAIELSNMIFSPILSIRAVARARLDKVEKMMISVL